MSAVRLRSWADVGARVAAARTAAGFTQQQLADRLGFHRSALARVERGQRQLDVLELVELAEVLGRTVEWFVTAPPALLASHRRERSEDRGVNALEDHLEQFARDVELLLEIRELPASPPTWDLEAVESVESAEAAALAARELVGAGEGPIHSLQGACEQVGLFSAALELGPSIIDGGYVQVQQAGVAVINGMVDAGRRRFNLAHELGHHLFADEYVTDFAIGHSREDRERLVNAFAIHMLMPRASVLTSWERLHREGANDRTALIRIAADYRVSWTAACAQARNLGLIERTALTSLEQARPTPADYVELQVSFVEELEPPAVSPVYARAVLRAYRHYKIGADRAVELLYGTLRLDDLPTPDELPLDALRHDFASPDGS